MKIIYDLGANNGDDIPYYLLRADKVVAVEANPALCNKIEQKFAKEISEERLAVVASVVTTAKEHRESVKFYLHRSNHVLSQFPKPDDLQDFDEVNLPSTSLKELFDQYGLPYYLKIDIENYDQEILRELFALDVFPVYLSAESHEPAVIAEMILAQKYTGFKLVEGFSVARKYKDMDVDGVSVSLTHHSAGPFGEDIEGPWFSKTDFLMLLGIEGMGWKDIHATTNSNPKDFIESEKILFLYRKILVRTCWFMLRRMNLFYKRIFRRK
ncbi:MAG: FkbM family methyltransferase [Planctomycetota bacterium]|nr:FkbM family methyltransferase [Planctomycetota bacterium]